MTSSAAIKSFYNLGNASRQARAAAALRMLNKSLAKEQRRYTPFYHVDSGQNLIHPWQKTFDVKGVSSEYGQTALDISKKVAKATAVTAGKSAANGVSATMHTALLLSMLLASPGGYKLLNEGVQLANYTPEAGGQVVVENPYDYNFDKFYLNYEELGDVVKALETSGLTPDLINRFAESPQDEDKIILNNPTEVKRTIALLMMFELIHKNDKEKEPIINKGRVALQKMLVHDLFIFGNDGFDSDDIGQFYEPNCQAMSGLKGMTLTTNQTQYLRGGVRVEKFDSTDLENNFEVTVNLNGTPVQVSYDDIKHAVCAKDFTASQSRDGGIATSLYNTYLKKSSPDSTPNAIPSSSNTLLTGRQYLPVFLLSLSDREIDEVLEQAPNSPVTVAGKFNLEDVFDGIAQRSKNWDNPEQSPEKQQAFDKQAQNLAHQAAVKAGVDTEKTSNPIRKTSGVIQGPLQKERLVASTFPPSAQPTTTAPQAQEDLLPAERTRMGHVYTVESYDADTKTLIITDAHGDRVKLQGEEIRENLSAVIAPSDSFNNFGDNFPLALGLYVISLSGLLLIERKLKYGLGNQTRKESLSRRAGSWIYEKTFKKGASVILTEDKLPKEAASI